MRKVLGFTLIELMITLAVAAILITVAIPSFRSIIQNNRVVTETNKFLTSINLARSEAIKRGQTVSVEPRQNGDWNTGWEIWVDRGGSNEERLKTLDPLDDAATITGGTGTINFQPSGQVGSQTCFDLSLSGSNEQRSIDIQATGRAMVTDSSCP